MSVRIYALARGKFARRETDWRGMLCSAFMVDTTYVPNVETDQSFPYAEIENAILAQIPLTNKTVSADGWCAADPLVYVNLVLGRSCGQVVIADTNVSRPVLLLEFPLLLPKATPDNYSLLFAQRGPGWFRL